MATVTGQCPEGMVAAACGMARAIVATRDGFGEDQGGGDVGGNAGEGGG